MSFGSSKLHKFLFLTVFLEVSSLFIYVTATCSCYTLVVDVRLSISLQRCQNLLILDLSDNAVTGTDNYRMFMIYHLSSLKAFDGIPVVSDTTRMTKSLFFSAIIGK